MTHHVSVPTNPRSPLHDAVLSTDVDDVEPGQPLRARVALVDRENVSAAFLSVAKNGQLVPAPTVETPFLDAHDLRRLRAAIDQALDVLDAQELGRPVRRPALVGAPAAAAKAEGD
jgi:hypothetical protein